MEGTDITDGGASGRGRLLGFYLYLLAALALPSQWLFWDDIGFLLAARAGDLDYGHLLYVPALRAFGALVAPLFGSEEYAAKLFSMLGGAVAFVLAWNRFERSDLRRTTALVVALLVTATPLFWRQLGLVEPSTWTLALLLLSAAAAEAYGRERSSLRLALLTLAFLATVGFHLVSVCALPWLVWLARGPAPAPPRAQLGLPLVLVLVLFGLAALVGDPLERIGAFVRYWASFTTLGDGESHVRVLASVFGSGAPALSAVALLALPLAWTRARAELGGALLLAAPYLVAFLLFGKPVVGLLLPCTLALGLVAAAGARVGERLAPGPAHALLATALALQAFVASAVALHNATTPDQGRVAAELYAGALPERALLVAGPLAHHVRWHTGAPVVPLPNLIHGALARGETDATPLGLLLAECEARLGEFDAVYLTTDAIDYLVAEWGVDRGEFPANDPATIAVGDDPPLALYLFAGRRE